MELEDIDNNEPAMGSNSTETNERDGESDVVQDFIETTEMNMNAEFIEPNGQVMESISKKFNEMDLGN